MVALRLVTTNGVGSNGVDSLPVFCRRTRTTSPSFNVVVFALGRLSARDFMFIFAAASFPLTTSSSADMCCLTSGSLVCGSRENISRRGVNYVVTWGVQRYARRNFRISLLQIVRLILAVLMAFMSGLLNASACAFAKWALSFADGYHCLA